MKPKSTKPPTVTQDPYDTWWGDRKNIPTETRRELLRWWKSTGMMLHGQLYAGPMPTWESVTLTPYQLLYLLNTHRDTIRALDQKQGLIQQRKERLQQVFDEFDYWCHHNDESSSYRA